MEINFNKIKAKTICPIRKGIKKLLIGSIIAAIVLANIGCSNEPRKLYRSYDPEKKKYVYTRKPTEAHTVEPSYETLESLGIFKLLENMDEEQVEQKTNAIITRRCLPSIVSFLSRLSR